jgi:hypothetical protein
MSNRKDKIDSSGGNLNIDWLEDKHIVEYLSKVPIQAMGPIPENHEGTYVPSKHEWIQGADFVLRTEIENLQERKKLNDHFRSLLGVDTK